jgi:hypothetical protein
MKLGKKGRDSKNKPELENSSGFLKSNFLMHESGWWSHLKINVP